MVNKARAEAFSDGVFAIILTLLPVIIITIFGVEVGKELEHATDDELWHEMLKHRSLFLSFFLSAGVLGASYLSHHVMFELFSRSINRIMLLLNYLYILVVVFVPFSAYMLGKYWYDDFSVVLYSTNIIVVGLAESLMLYYALASREIENGDYTVSHLGQALLGQLTPVVFSALAIIVTLFLDKNIVPIVLLAVSPVVGVAILCVNVGKEGIQNPEEG